MFEILCKVFIMALLILISILCLFLFVDCKMDKAHLQVKTENLETELSNFRLEMKALQDTYAQFVAKKIAENKLKFEDLKQELPPKARIQIADIYRKMKELSEENNHGERQ